MTDNAGTQRVVLFETDVAEELLDLVADRPGQADEDLLDRAVAALSAASEGLSADAQQAVARGDAVAVGLAPSDVDSLRTLIESDTESDPSALREIARTLKGKLRAASKKATT